MQRRQKWDQWMRECIKDPYSPIRLPGSLGMLTGQDYKALATISDCWELYACSDAKGQMAALDAIRSLLLAMQQQCRPFAREVIGFTLEWSDRERLWPLVTT